MKGIILAGGTGSRLYPSTKAVNKHLLPVFDRPMIYYPIQTLKKSGINEILIISDNTNLANFMKLLGSGNDMDVNFTYKIQDGTGGIAQALSLAKNFAAGDDIAVILADNIFEDDFAEQVINFRSGSKIFVKKVKDPTRFGIVEFDEDGNIKSIEEKPLLPKSNFAQCGFYLYDNKVFNYIDQISPSDRGELEITDVNKLYLEHKALTAEKIYGMWIDAGTHESLLEASILAQEAFDPERIRLRQKQSPTPTVTSHTIPKLTVGIATHNSEKYIEPCLKSILKQNYGNIEIIIYDNNSKDKTVEKIKEISSEIKIIQSNKNIGFGAAHNAIINESDASYYACLNIDAIFEQNFLSELVKALEQKPVYGSAGGKLKRWNFEKYEQGDENVGKTNFIDSTGIKFLKSHRFEDIGQGEVDYGQYNNSRNIFGVSGAAVLYRMNSLEDIAYENNEGKKEYFDESMKAYKEDVDLSYRLQWAGWKAIYTPKAVGYHNRTVEFIDKKSVFSLIKNRLKKSRKNNTYSFLNHQIMLEKNYSHSFGFKTKRATFWYNAKVFFYILFFETESLTAWWQFHKLKKRIKDWKTKMPRRVSGQEIEKMMQ